MTQLNEEDLPSYYRTWIEGSKLIAIIPARSKRDPKNRSYYSVKSLTNTQISPVFLFNDSFSDPIETKDAKGFIFDSEFNKMYGYEYKDNNFIKLPTYEETVNTLKKNPIVLFFMGCDDGHVGLRFETEESSYSFLESLSVFEDVFKSPNLQYHN